MPNTSDHFERLKTAVSSLLVAGDELTPASIRELIGKVRQAPLFAVTDDEAERLARMMEERHAVTMGIGSLVMAKHFEPWLQAARPSIQPYFWERYNALLISAGYARSVLTTMDQTTERVLGLSGNPQSESQWDRRGMVMGHVQSGKTAHYIGLVCKAADAGYKLIVVIAGLSVNLRNQTQRRIDEGFVGRDSSRLGTGQPKTLVGVGRIDDSRLPVTFTTAFKDFHRSTATSIGMALKDLNGPAVFVIKKDQPTLDNLLGWLSDNNAGTGHGQIDYPLLVVDDEADNASVNIGYQREKVSTINLKIRQLLSRFSRSTYVGYTATPFANIFIDPDSDEEMIGEDLFPRHFITTLEPPTNYLGPDAVFLDDDSLLRDVADSEDLLPLRHKITHHVTALPRSLTDAVRVFVLARAIRIRRGLGNQHSSMLVNVSRFRPVQSQVARLIHDDLKRIERSIRLFADLAIEEALQDTQLARLRDLWRVEFEEQEGPWDRIQGVLSEAVAPIGVRTINSESADALDYQAYADTGLQVIAVGGMTLSRGLTLEGLTVSYLLRNSRMYDTLLQMGRWFGYRDGYRDLCRIYMPEALQGWYERIAEATGDLREELREMEASGAEPIDFGLKVRAHPGVLMITARNKIGTGQTVVVNVGLANHFIETSLLRTGDALTANRAVAQALLNTLEAVDAHHVTVPGGTLCPRVPVDTVLAFLSGFINHDASLLTAKAPVTDYIRRRAVDELAEWDVLIAHTYQGKAELTFRFAGATRYCQQRTAGTPLSDDGLRITNKQRVASRGIERTGLSATRAADAEESFARDNPALQKPDGSFNYPDRIYRHVRERPLLIVHNLEVVEAGSGRRLYDKPVVAWSISFPGSQIDAGETQYMVNKTWIDQYLGPADEGDDESLD